MIFKRYEVQRLKRVAALCQGKSVLDIGYAQLPNPYFRSLYRVGVDLQLPKQPVEYEEAIVGDASHAPELLEGRQFDNVVATEFIEHLENPYEFLRSIRSCIAPGGRVIISTPNPVSFPCVFAEWMRNKRRFYTKDHTYYFCPRWVERMLDVSGYRVSRVEGVGLWIPPLIVPCPVSISYQVIYVAEPVAAPCGVAGT